MKGRLRPVDYLVWAQSVPADVRWDLTASGVSDTCGPASLNPQWEFDSELTLAGLSRRDRGPAVIENFLRVISARYGVAPECVVPTLGASQAMTQVLFALARPGDHVIVERPTYESLHRVPEMLGLSVSRLERKVEESWEPLPDRLARLLTPKTRAVILSSLYDPSGVAIEASTLEAIGEMVARVGALVLVDEVHLDFAFDASGESYPWRPACVTIENGVSWSSVTKAFGFSALRVGWLADEPRVSWVPPSAGHTGLIRLPELTADLDFARHLNERYGTQVVPGTMFEAPGFVRVSFGLSAKLLEQALGTFSAALDDLELGRAVS